MRHRQPNTHVIQETYRRAELLGLDLDSVSDENLVRSFAAELKKIKHGGRPRFSASVHHKLRVMGLLRDGTLTAKGVQLLAELEEGH